jgi:radical SAM protein with 4Fe4S-binding SPASM domain
MLEHAGIPFTTQGVARTMLRWRNLPRTMRKAIRDPRYSLAAGRRRFASWWSYRFENGRSAPPETVSLFLTYRCNLRCTMCGQWGEDGWARKLSREALAMELPLERIDSLLDDVARWKPAITLFGGEPLLYGRWEELVRHIKSRGLRVNMITNGTLLDKYVEKVVELGIDEIIFSLDGPEAIHDAMRNGEGIFRKAVGAFTALNLIRVKAGSVTPRINISTTIFENNYRHLGEVADIAESFGADAITFHHLIFLSRAVCERNSEVFRSEFKLDCADWTGFARDTLPEIDVEFLIRTLHDLVKRKSRIAVSVYPNFTDEEIRRYYTSFEFKSDSYSDRCISPWTTAYVFPNGEVKPCLDTCFSAGNILREPFREIWNNERIRAYRAALKRRGSFPACSRCTEFYRA